MYNGVSTNANKLLTALSAAAVGSSPPDAAEAINSVTLDVGRQLAHARPYNISRPDACWPANNHTPPPWLLRGALVIVVVVVVVPENGSQAAMVATSCTIHVGRNDDVDDAVELATDERRSPASKSVYAAKPPISGAIRKLCNSATLHGSKNCCRRRDKNMPKLPLLVVAVVVGCENGIVFALARDAWPCEEGCSCGDCNALPTGIT